MAFDPADDLADDSLRWERYQTVSRGLRAVGLSVRTIETQCVLNGSRFVGPLLDEGFLSSLAA